MSELLLPPQEVSDDIKSYGRALLHFLWNTDFPDGLLSDPDYLMIKSANVTDFDNTVKAIRPWAERAAFVDIDTRFLVAAHLITPMALTQNKQIDWLEVMEAKSPDGTADYLGAEYVQFYYGDFNHAGLLLKSKRIEAEKRADGLHRWWNVRMNDKGQELRITDRSISDIIDGEINDGTAKPLPLAA